MRRKPTMTVDSELAVELNDVAKLRESMAMDIRDAKAALTAYEIALLSFAERLLWVAQLDLIIYAKYDNGKLVISLEAPSGRDRENTDERLFGPAEPFEDIIAEYLKKLDPENDFSFGIQSNLLLPRAEANRIRQRLGLRRKLRSGKRHEGRKQKGQ